MCYTSMPYNLSCAIITLVYVVVPLAWPLVGMFSRDKGDDGNQYVGTIDYLFKVLKSAVVPPMFLSPP